MSIFRNLLKPKVLIASAVLVVAGLVGYGVVQQQNAANAANCSSNDVIKCGYKTPSELASKVNGSSELRALHNYDFVSGYGIGNTTDFKNNAKSATVYKDGRVVLSDGTVVATGANSLGREKFNGNRVATPKIGGKTWYYGSTRDNFAANSLKAYVLLNPLDHSMQFAALTECGNPVWGKSPGYYCKELHTKEISNTTREFWTTPFVKNGAKVKKVVYDFGDGTTITKTNPSEKVRHTYKKAGNYTAKVTVYFDVNGKEKKHTRSECTKKITVKEEKKPFYACEGLTPRRIGKEEDRKYGFKVSTKEGDGATFQKVDYNFGDGQTATRNDKNEVEHTYAQPGEYTITTTVYFTVGSAVKEVKDQKCTTKITIKKVEPPFYACKSLQARPMQPDNKESLEYGFKVVTAEGNGATFQKVVYTFGDGNTAERTNKDEVTHTFADFGEYTITADVYFNVGSDVKNSKCETKVKIKKELKPFQICKDLRIIERKDDQREYTFEVETEQRDGPKFVRADFDFGDGQTATNIQPASENTARATHRYDAALEGEVAITATVYFTTTSGEVSDKCVTKLAFEKPPVEECPERPGEGLPVGHPDCKEQPEEPEEPPFIPETGPAEIIGSALGLSTIAGVGMYYRNSRRQLLDQILKR